VTSTVAPVMNAADDEAKKATTSATSCAVPKRPIGIRLRAARLTAVSGGPVISLRIRPGAIQLTVLPCGARSRAAARVKPISPALEAVRPRDQRYGATRDRSDIDNASMAPCDHRRRHETCENERPIKIDINDLLPFLKRGLHKPRGVRILPLGRYPCIIYEDCNLVPALPNTVDETSHIISSSHVDRLGDESIFVPTKDIKSPLDVLGLSGHQGDPAAISQKPANDRKANATGSPSHNDDAPIAFAHLGLPGSRALAHGQTVANGVTGELTAPGRRSGGAVRKKHLASLPLHEFCLFKVGIALSELWYLSDLSTWLRQHRRLCFTILWPSGKRLDPDIVRD